jgi:antiviral helicase SLH1
LAIDDELQTILPELLGYESLDLVMLCIQHRRAIVASRIDDGAPSNGVKKLQTRQEREAALHRQDLEHKNAPLGAQSHFEKPKYPHVYTTQATGNTISWTGAKYSLPVGSERVDREVRQILLYQRHILTSERNMKNIQYQLPK